MQTEATLRTENSMKGNKLVIAVMLAGGLMASEGVYGDETTEAIKQLKQQIEVLDQKVRLLEREQELESEQSAAKAKETPEITIGERGLSVSSKDSNFVFQLRGQVQVDNRTFFNDRDNKGKSIQNNDSFLLRRARPIFSGTVYKDFDFMFVPDFAGTSAQIFDAYLNYRYAPWLQLRAGKFKTPVGLEQLQADQWILFNERALPTDLVPIRDIGFQLGGDVAEGTLSYAAGVFNGVADGRNSFNADYEDHREFAGRLFLQPFKTREIAPLQNLGFGLAGSWGRVSSSASGLPSALLTDGQQAFFTYTNGVVADGTHWRLSPHGCYYYGPFGFLGEFILSNQRVAKSAASANLQNSAWQIAGSWVLTGEDATYAGVTPKRPFDPRANHWGAVQLVARYAELNVDNGAFPVFANPGTSASAARAWAAGLNWYLNRDVRMDASFSHTTFGGHIDRNTATVVRQPEEVVFTRMQLAF